VIALGLFAFHKKKGEVGF